MPRLVFDLGVLAGKMVRKNVMTPILPEAMLASALNVGRGTPTCTQTVSRWEPAVQRAGSAPAAEVAPGSSHSDTHASPPLSAMGSAIPSCGLPCRLGPDRRTSRR